MIINSDLIETVEATPDTVITLTTDKKWVILESPEELLRRVKAYKQEIYSSRPRLIGDQGNPFDA